MSATCETKVTEGKTEKALALPAKPLQQLLPADIDPSVAALTAKFLAIDTKPRPSIFPDGLPKVTIVPMLATHWGPEAVKQLRACWDQPTEFLGTSELDWWIFAATQACNVISTSTVEQKRVLLRLLEHRSCMAPLAPLPKFVLNVFISDPLSDGIAAHGTVPQLEYIRVLLLLDITRDLCASADEKTEDKTKDERLLCLEKAVALLAQVSGTGCPQLTDPLTLLETEYEQRGEKLMSSAARKWARHLCEPDDAIAARKVSGTQGARDLLNTLYSDMIRLLRAVDRERSAAVINRLGTNIWDICRRAETMLDADPELERSQNGTQLRQSIFVVSVRILPREYFPVPLRPAEHVRRIERGAVAFASALKDDKHPFLGEAAGAIGQLLFSMGAHKRSLSYFQKANALLRKENTTIAANSFLWLTKCLIGLSRPSEACAVLRDALKWDPFSTSPKLVVWRVSVIIQLVTALRLENGSEWKEQAAALISEGASICTKFGLPFSARLNELEAMVQEAEGKWCGYVLCRLSKSQSCGLTVCTRCLCAYYCSQKCRDADTEHRINCMPIVILRISGFRIESGDQAERTRVPLRCDNCSKVETTVKQFRVCSGCRLAAYCSADCQKRKWKTHKPKCHPVSLPEQKSLGSPLLPSDSEEKKGVTVTAHPPSIIFASSSSGGNELD